MKHFKQQLLDALEQQPRLPWLLLAAGIILLTTLAKFSYDALNESSSQITQALTLNAKLQSLVNADISEETIQKAQQVSQDMLDAIQTASSQSAAEATSLELAQQEFTLIKDLRTRVLGSEPIDQSAVKLWSVRVEIRGKLTPSNFPTIAKQLDSTQASKRLVSMQYNIKASDSFSVVVDYLHRDNQNAN